MEGKMHTEYQKVKGVWHLRLGRKGSKDEVSKSNQADGEVAQEKNTIGVKAVVQTTYYLLVS